MPAAKKKSSKEDLPAEALSGVYMFPNGDKYDGEFSKRDDGTQERCGHGIHITSDGTRYEGDWENDKMNGQGRMEFPSGSFYEGTFVNNEFHGTGHYQWPNGSYYDGTFCQNKMEGDGKFCDTDGQIWSGTFRYKAAPGLRFQLEL